MNKSRTHEYRVRHRSDWSWPYYIQYRRRSILGWLMGWTNYSEYNIHPLSIKTFKTLKEAISYVDDLINFDKKRDTKVIDKQVWPEPPTDQEREEFYG